MVRMRFTKELSRSERRLANLLARIAQLRMRSVREATGLYYVEGLRNVFCALDAGVTIESLV